MTTTCAATTTATTVAAVALGGAFALRTEVTKLTSEFSIEAVFEADLDNVARCVSCVSGVSCRSAVTAAIA